MGGWVGCKSTTVFGRFDTYKEGVESKIIYHICIKLHYNTSGEYSFSSLVKKKKEKIYALFYFAGKMFFFIFMM